MSFTLALLVATAVLFASVGTAAARTISPYVYSGTTITNPDPGSGGQFSCLAALGFDSQNQILYTGEGTNRVRKFDPDGDPLPFSDLGGATTFSVNPKSCFEAFPGSAQIAVDETPGSLGDFYTTLSGELRGWTLGGSPKPGFPFPEGAPNKPIIGQACGVALDPQGDLWSPDTASAKISEVDTQGNGTGQRISPEFTGGCRLAIDADGNFYVVSNGAIRKVSPTGEVLYDLELARRAIDLTIDPDTGDLYVVTPASDTTGSARKQVVQYRSDSPKPVISFGSLPEAAPSYPGIFGDGLGIAINRVNKDIYVGSYEGVAVFSRQPATTVPTVITGTALPSLAEVQLRGSVEPDGVPTTACYFEWGTSAETYGNVTPCAEGEVLNGSGEIQVSASISGLSPGGTYHFRLVAKNANEIVELGEDAKFVVQDKPKIADVYASKVNADGAVIHALVAPEFGSTVAHVEYGIDDTYGKSAPIPAVLVPGNASVPNEVEIPVKDLESGTEYHYRVVATNAAGQTIGDVDHTFVTYPAPPVAPIDDPCPNALARQQTGSILLLDCRAYELVSAYDAAGYNVESDLVPGQTPFPGYPHADGRVLYGVHSGGVPGAGDPTNHGIDPYVASRDSDGWATKYVGIPSAGSPSAGPFASGLLGADNELDTFAFGGPELCDPCFGDGSSGIPVREGGAGLAQGMRGTLDPGPGAVPDGLIRKAMSADGSHLLFGSTSQFEPDGNDDTGDVSIYDRNLTTGVTQVVSKTPAGANLPCLQGAGSCHSPGNTSGIAALDISEDGSRIVVAQRVDIDPAGNSYWHPYLHVGSADATVDLAPGTTSGVRFDGMTADGSRVFMSTVDPLLDDDTDSSVDIYVAAVDGTGPAELSLISTDGDSASNDDSCTPPGDWNVASGAPDCSALAFAGGGGVALDSGDFFFLSPEQLDGTAGTDGLPNLYLAAPGESPRFVVTMDSEEGKPPAPPAGHPVEDDEFIDGLEGPEAIAVDQSNGDIYVKQRTNSTVARFDSSGDPRNFSAGPDAGTNVITGETLGGTAEGQVAVDSHPGSLFEGAFYVTSAGTTVSVYANSGLKLGTLTDFNYVCGVAVDQSTGTLYVGDYYGGLWKLVATSNATPVTNANYEKTHLYPQFQNGFLQTMYPCQIAADSAGHLFASQLSNGPVARYDTDRFSDAPSTPFVTGPRVSNQGTALAVDPDTDEVYVDVGSGIEIRDHSGPFEREATQQTIGTGVLSESRGVGVDSDGQAVYAANGNAIVKFGYTPSQPKPITSTAILHAVGQADTRDTTDFQVSRDGRFAVFPTAAPLTGYDSDNRSELFRYDAETDGVDCVSCSPTNAHASGDAAMATQGLSVTEDGRVFFTTPDPLVLRDTDETKDAYEWSNGKQELISAGTSRFDSGLLTVTASGGDAYFFTSDVLAPEDKNGSVVKIYDARTEGGFFVLPPDVPCAASDECHGPGSKAPATPQIPSVTSTGRKAVPGGKRCRKGFVKKRGKCVKKRRNHKKHPRRNQQRNG